MRLFLLFILLLLHPFDLKANSLKIYFKKNQSLFVIRNAEKNTIYSHIAVNNAERIDNAVGEYSASDGAVAYTKGTTLYVVKNIDSGNQYTPFLVDYAVGEFDLEDDFLAYKKLNGTLYVYNLKTNKNVRITTNVEQFSTRRGMILFTKNLVTLYVADDFSRDGIYRRIMYPVGEIDLQD